IIAPMRERNMTRSEEIEYAIAKGVPISQSLDKIWSIDENLWGRSIEGGRLEEPDYAPPEEIFHWTASPEDAPDQPTDITIGFEEGIPVSLDGVELGPVELIKSVHKLACENGIGRVDVMEDRMLGLKVRENYECPAAVILIKAHKALENLVATRGEIAFKATVDQKWADLAYEGLWYDPLKEDLEAFIDTVNKRVSGEVVLRLYKGSVSVSGRRSPWALYSEDMASFNSKTFDQSEMGGMVKVHGMQAKMYHHIKNAK
ncbi:MAG: argininosuccinate synthase, partial [Armatimonadota bacterium]